MASDLAERIRKLKKERDAILLVHNYQIPEVQDIADFLGDSIDLSRKAAGTENSVIVFCGVYFMAETAKILSPEKKVLIPEKSAGCPLADTITVAELRKLKDAHPEAEVVCYVNSTAEVKAESDVCCTSANALEVVNSLKGDEVIFVPDKYLASYVSRNTEKTIIPWKGYCPTHAGILPEHVMKAKEEHPKAKVIVHPECIPKVIDLADEVLSTGGMCKYAKESDATEFIIGTEREMAYRLRKDNPGKRFYPVSEATICPNMKKTTPEKILQSLEDMKYEVEVSEEIRARAKKAVEFQKIN